MVGVDGEEVDGMALNLERRLDQRTAPGHEGCDDEDSAGVRATS